MRRGRAAFPVPAGSANSTTAANCGVCGDSGVERLHHVRELFLGTRDVFTYAECRRCHALQLCDPPDLDRYYRHEDYRPLQQAPAPTPSRPERLIRILATEIRLRTIRDYRHWIYPLRLAGASRRSRILDVGCGSGSLLWHMQSSGFGHLTGLDPDTEPSTNGVTILVGTLDSYAGSSFDIIMFNDSLEHVPDPLSSLRQARGHLREGGTIVVRIPITGTFHWRAYGVCWVGLDAPRHLHVPTEEGFRELVDRASLRLLHSFHDSTEFGFWGSELYKRGFSMNDDWSTVFSADEMEEWRRLAGRLNACAEGDHATFVLSK